MTPPDVLFWTHEWDATVDQRRAALRERSYGLSEDDLEAGEAELARRLAAEFALEIPRLHTDRLDLGPAAASGDPMRDFEMLRDAAARREVFVARLPFSGDPQMFTVRPLRGLDAPTPGRVRGEALELTLSGEGLTRAEAEPRVWGWIDAVSDNLLRQAESLGRYPEDIARLAATCVRRRVEELAADRELWSGFEILQRPAIRGR
jgi:hypothetical protein